MDIHVFTDHHEALVFTRASLDEGLKTSFMGPASYVDFRPSEADPDFPEKDGVSYYVVIVQTDAV